ncbi:hypothetical protein DIJ64_11885 [Mycobacterium leprae]|uniref:Uncharacterized protein n=1 Tax=Mycobacterium leprae TaxID=1769 RepID=A0AAD0P9F7_MYCLR|nr:hypothetical protein DIJ64_11885 [Mycobacterium leprae]
MCGKGTHVQRTDSGGVIQTRRLSARAISCESESTGGIRADHGLADLASLWVCWYWFDDAHHHIDLSTITATRNVLVNTNYPSEPRIDLGQPFVPITVTLVIHLGMLSFRRLADRLAIVDLYVYEGSPHVF